MQLYRFFPEDSGIAVIVDTPTNSAPVGIASAAFDKMHYIAAAREQQAFWMLLDQALADERITAVAVSLNDRCVFDDELPARLEQACARASGTVDWAVLAGTGKCANGMTCSVAYPSATPRLFLLNIPQPIVDCGLEIFIINADFLRASRSEWQKLTMPPESFAHWCILAGYLKGRVSVFRPELAIGIDGNERERNFSRHTAMLDEAFSRQLPDDTIPSLMGDISLSEVHLMATQTEPERNPRENALTRPVVPLAELVRQAVIPACIKMSLSVITRTQFTRLHLLRRMLSTLTRARQDLDITLEVVMSTDIDANEAHTAHTALQREFPELELALQLNEGHHPHSRVDNLVGGILAARKDYIAILDDDDFVDLDALKAISTARFLGHSPLLIMSSQVRNETWCKSGSGRWILESSEPEKTYSSTNIRYMFKGSNQLPVCAMIAPREWMQNRLQNIVLRHDLSEDYTIHLVLLCAQDLPPLLTHADIFCMISSRNDNSNTITMTDRRPWVRDITLFLHDIFVADPVPGSGVAQIMGQDIRVSPNTTVSYLDTVHGSEAAQQGREIALLKAEIDYLRDLLANGQTDQ